MLHLNPKRKTINGVAPATMGTSNATAAAAPVVSNHILGFTRIDDAGAISFVVQDKWTDLLQLVLITVIGAYFGGRSLEKVKK